MKSIQSKSVMVVVAIFAMIAISCQKNDQISPSGQIVQKESAVLEDFPLPDMDVLQMPVLQESTIDQELSVINEGIPSEETLNLSFDEKSAAFTSAGVTGQDLAKLLNTLQLTREQKVKLHNSIIQYRDCRRELYVKVKRITTEIIEKGNAERKELISKYLKGDISKEQLQKALVALNIRIKKAIAENTDRKIIILQIEKCWKTYVENLRLILTKQQMELLMKWHKLNH